MGRSGAPHSHAEFATSGPVAGQLGHSTPTSIWWNGGSVSKIQALRPSSETRASAVSGSRIWPGSSQGKTPLMLTLVAMDCTCFHRASHPLSGANEALEIYLRSRRLQSRQFLDLHGSLKEGPTCAPIRTFRDGARRAATGQFQTLHCPTARPLLLSGHRKLPVCFRPKPVLGARQLECCFWCVPDIRA